jgi:signal transduction histidine kinase
MNEPPAIAPVIAPAIAPVIAPTTGQRFWLLLPWLALGLALLELLMAWPSHWAAIVWARRAWALGGQWSQSLTWLQLLLDAATVLLTALLAALLLARPPTGWLAAQAGLRLLLAALWLGLTLLRGQWLTAPAALLLVLPGLLGLVLVFLLDRCRRAGPTEPITNRWLAVTFASSLIVQVIFGLLIVITGLAQLLESPAQPWLVLLPQVIEAIGLMVTLLALLIALSTTTNAKSASLLNRFLVFLGLSVLIALLYGGLAGVLALVFGSNLAGNGVWGTLIAALVVAFVAQPLQTMLQGGVNRLMYGERDDPYSVLAKLSAQTGLALAPGLLLPQLLATLAQSLRLPYLALALDDEQVAVGGVAPPSSFALEQWPLLAQGECIGQLQVARRAEHWRFSHQEQLLLASAAGQIAAVAQQWLLQRELEASRQRLMLAQEDERRRLRRDLHDGLGPSLAALVLQIETARLEVGRAPAKAETRLLALKTEVQGLVAEIRRLVYNLRPPQLDDLGLLPALEQLLLPFYQADMLVELLLPAALPTPLAAALEVAIYRVAQEALTNVLKHAGATAMSLKLELKDHWLILSISDNGSGLPNERVSGVGSRSMRERCQALGGQLLLQGPASGGTLVEASWPLKPSLLI